VYQSSKGGRQYVPLEESCGLIGVNTPRWAKMVSWKYSHLPSAGVAEDFRQNHRRSCVSSHIQSLSYEVGSLLLAQQSQLRYFHGVDMGLVKSVSLGRDGAILRLNDDSY